VTLGVAFALDGLAVAHYLSRGSGFRIFLLVFIYLGLAVPVTWLAFLLLLVLIGIIETALSLRDRKDKTDSRKP
jgi:ABC-type dipeptide/oligopeptide/nickel transport system permease component